MTPGAPRRDNAAMNATEACPCQSARAYAQCCAPLHRGDAVAQSAEALMRSRYSAYVRGDAAYLLATWHASTRPQALDFGDAGATRWLGLEVKRHQLLDADRATVEFVARYRVGGAAAVRLHEISRFVREDGRWYYLDGEFPER
ncbi:YchJ family protein [Agrilutibacter niabensis]